MDEKKAKTAPEHAKLSRGGVLPEHKILASSPAIGAALTLFWVNNDDLIRPGIVTRSMTIIYERAASQRDNVFEDALEHAKALAEVEGGALYIHPDYFNWEKYEK